MSSAVPGTALLPGPCGEIDVAVSTFTDTNFDIFVKIFSWSTDEKVTVGFGHGASVVVEDVEGAEVLGGPLPRPGVDSIGFKLPKPCDLAMDPEPCSSIIHVRGVPDPLLIGQTPTISSIWMSCEENLPPPAPPTSNPSPAPLPLLVDEEYELNAAPHWQDASDDGILPAAGTEVLPAAGTEVLPAAGTEVLPAAGTEVLPAAGTEVLPAAGTEGSCILGCKSEFLGDGECDELCNAPECREDDGDCSAGTECWHLSGDGSKIRTMPCPAWAHCSGRVRPRARSLCGRRE